MELVVYCPSRKHGGTVMLFARIAAELALRKGIRIVLVDYVAGKTAEYLRTRGVKFSQLPFDDKPITVNQGSHFLINLLSSKLIGTAIFLPPTIRLILWSTYTYDAFKYLPISNLFNSASVAVRHKVARWLHPVYSRRVARFLAMASERNGLIWMEERERIINSRIYDVKLCGPVVPIFTEEPTLQWQQKGMPRRIGWVGRLADFKAEAVAAIIRELDALAVTGSAYEFVIVGDGNEAYIPQRAGAQCRYLKPEFVGHVPHTELDQLLCERVDLVIGHATALLEAAKLGIPALVVDGFYFSPRVGELRVEWFHRCPDGYIGKIAPAAVDLCGRALGICLAEWEANCSELGNRSKAHWARNHAPESVSSRFCAIAAAADFTAADFQEIGARKLDAHGAIIEWVKARLRSRREMRASRV